jgi:phage terminase large subunit GpA-like protein
MHHASWGDGGLSYPSFRDRGDIVAIRSFAQMTLSDDDRVRETMKQFIEDERIFQHIEQDPDAQFFNWKDEDLAKSRISTIIGRIRRACRELSVKLKLEGRQLVIRTTESEMKTKLAAGIGRFLTQKVIRPRKIESLLRKEKHGATFTTL